MIWDQFHFIRPYCFGHLALLLYDIPHCISMYMELAANGPYPHLQPLKEYQGIIRSLIQLTFWIQGSSRLRKSRPLGPGLEGFESTNRANEPTRFSARCRPAAPHFL